MKNLCTELEQTWHEEIPISKAMGIRVADFANDQLVVRAELEPNINVHGTAFAGSLYAIAALCGWGMTWLQLKLAAYRRQHRHRRRSHPLRTAGQRAASSRRAASSSDDQANALARLARDGKTRFMLDCVIRANGHDAARFTGDYAVRVNDPPARLNVVRIVHCRNR